MAKVVKTEILIHGSHGMDLFILRSTYIMASNDLQDKGRDDMWWPCFDNMYKISNAKWYLGSCTKTSTLS